MSTHELLSVINKNGTTFSRGPKGTHRVFIADCTGWASLDFLQKDAVCALVCAVLEGNFEIKESWIGQEEFTVRRHRLALATV